MEGAACRGRLIARGASSRVRREATSAPPPLSAFLRSTNTSTANNVKEVHKTTRTTCASQRKECDGPDASALRTALGCCPWPTPATHMPKHTPREPQASWSTTDPRVRWLDIVHDALAMYDGEATLLELHTLIGRHPRARLDHGWPSKVHKILLKSGLFEPRGGGRWGFATRRASRRS